MAIKHTMAHLKKGISLESDSGKRYKLQEHYNELQLLLEDKLNECGEFRG